MTAMQTYLTKILLLVCLGALTGCAQFDSGKAVILDRGAALEDNILHDAETVQCRVVSIGAWIRRYGNSPELAQAWRTLCNQAVTQTPAKP